jgi:hypothetical protein
MVDLKARTVTGSYLRLRFDDDGDGTGNLPRAEANGFAGESAAYFGKGQLEDFATALAAFPLVGRPTVVGGFRDKVVQGRMEQEHLAIECYPFDAKGNLGLRVRMATELWTPSRPESQHMVALEIRTTYESLRYFSRRLQMLVRGETEEARLDGE